MGYTTVDDRLEPQTLYGLKDRLISPSVDIGIRDANRFEVEITGEQFNQAVRKDLYYGMVRINGLLRGCARMIDQDIPAAWALVTCYYVSFFSAVELLRCSGQYVTYLDSDHINRITERARLPIGGALESGTYHGLARYNALTGIVTVAFAKRQVHHHEFTWHEMRQLVSQVGAATGIDAIRKERLTQFLGRTARPYWPMPSEVRNHWNYEDAALFGPQGESFAKEFRKHLNREAAYNWSTRKNMSQCASSEISGIGFTSAVLSYAIEDVCSALLPDRLIQGSHR